MLSDARPYRWAVLAFCVDGRADSATPATTLPLSTYRHARAYNTDNKRGVADVRVQVEVSP